MKWFKENKNLLIDLGVIGIIIIGVVGYILYQNIQAIKIIKYCVYNEDLDICGSSRDINYPEIEKIYGCSLDEDCIIVEIYGNRSYESIAINTNYNYLWKLVNGENIISLERQNTWCVQNACWTEPESIDELHNLEENINE